MGNVDQLSHNDFRENILSPSYLQNVHYSTLAYRESLEFDNAITREHVVFFFCLLPDDFNFFLSLS